MRHLLLGVALLSASTAAAEPPSTDVLIGDLDAAPELIARLAAELRFRGFGVSQVRLEAMPNPDDLERLAQERGAMAALLLRPDAGRVQVWVVDRVTQKIVIRIVDADEDLATTARRAVEVLRASLLELQVLEPESVAVEPPPAAVILAEPPVVEPTPPAPTRVQLAVGAAGEWGPGGVGPALALDLRLSGRVHPNVWVGALSRLPVVAADVPFDRGDLRWSALSVGATVRVHPWVGARLDPFVALRVEATRARVESDPLPPLIGADDSAWLARFGLELGARVELTRNLGLQLSIDAATTGPRATIRAEGERAARWGTVVLASTLSLVVRI